MQKIHKGRWRILDWFSLEKFNCCLVVSGTMKQDRTVEKIEPDSFLKMHKKRTGRNSHKPQHRTSDWILGGWAGTSQDALEQVTQRICSIFILGDMRILSGQGLEQHDVSWKLVLLWGGGLTKLILKVPSILNFSVSQSLKRRYMEYGHNSAC